MPSNEIDRLRAVKKHDGAWFSEDQISQELAEEIMQILENPDTQSSDYQIVQESQVSFMGDSNIAYMILMFENAHGSKKFFDYLENSVKGK